MNKNIYYWMFLTFTMLVLPWIAVTWVPNDAAMIITIVLLFVVNPLCFLAIGIFAGKNIKYLWWYPIITAIFFLVGAWIFYGLYELAFLMYGGCYIIIGIVSMFVSAYTRN